jgi:hypothetical protein
MPRLPNLHAAASTLGTTMSTLTFSLTRDVQQAAPFVPRLGAVSIQREDGSTIPDILTPGLITTTSRGVIPHLFRDHARQTEAVRWIQLPFESL